MLASTLTASVLALAPPSPSPGADDAPRGNTVLTRRRGVVWGAAAVPRVALLIGDGARVMQPVGFGAELQLSAYALHLGALRFGGRAHFGHTRVLDRLSFQYDDGSGAGVQPVTRYAALGHTDFSLGPAAQVVLGPILVEGGATVGLGISNLVRPLGPLPTDEVQTSDTTAMLRGGGQIAVPIRRNQGVSLGVHATRFFSNTQVVANPDPTMPDALPDANPFDLVLEIGVGYHMWF
ncbi:hypothetical protein [Paraliomyxa miuraensis]|uniref:hypothetical protein n=1 Tax=Paraliomyxa miuraensis TaxID=376150 RepID=UPI00224EED30|nr:hypothetical protein [Paraliomyxa miuraensis]MCX4243858.1 hypothetical protein [Paraliomyxa miuraensis]